MMDLCLWSRAPSMLNGTDSKAQLAPFVWLSDQFTLARVFATARSNGPSPLSKTGAVIPMRQVRGATMTGATIKPAKLLPVPSHRFTRASFFPPIFCSFGN
jgi:hypothetical protein